MRDYGVNGQIGLEDTPEAYIDRLVDVFREVKRVLRDDGTIWVNIGDSFWGGKGKSGQSYSPQYQNERYNGGRSLNGAHHQIGGKKLTRPTDKKHPMYKPKDLVGIPWMLAFALRADGWYLRSDIIWAKGNGMPESVTDRPTRSHEYIFLLSKSHSYYYDHESIRTPLKASSKKRLEQDVHSQKGSDRQPGKTNGNMKAVGGKVRKQRQRAMELFIEKGLTQAHLDAIRAVGLSDTGKNKQTQTGANKNTEEVIRLANEAREALGSYTREFLFKPVEPKQDGHGRRHAGFNERWDNGDPQTQAENGANKKSVWHCSLKGYKGAHFATYPPDLIEPCIKAGSPHGGIILDPFSGAGTTALVARRLGRRFIAIELNPEYINMAERRLKSELGPLDQFF